MLSSCQEVALYLMILISLQAVQIIAKMVKAKSYNTKPVVSGMGKACCVLCASMNSQAHSAYRRGSRRVVNTVASPLAEWVWEHGR